MDLPYLVFDAEHKNVLAVLVGSFTAVLPQRSDDPNQIFDGQNQHYLIKAYFVIWVSG